MYQRKATIDQLASYRMTRKTPELNSIELTHPKVRQYVDRPTHLLMRIISLGDAGRCCVTASFGISARLHQHENEQPDQ